MNAATTRTAKARAAVFAACLQHPRYLAMTALKERLGARWNLADAYREPKAAQLAKRFDRVCRALGTFEDRALRAAGL
jgi:hypothetical protein